MTLKCSNDKTKLVLKNDKVEGVGLNKYNYFTCPKCGFEKRVKKRDVK